LPDLLQKGIRQMSYTDPDNEMDLLEWERECLDAGEPFWGDPRRCPSHPHVRTSSDDGMFDGPCWVCEQAMNEDPELADAEWASELARVGIAKAVMTSPLWIAEFNRRAAEKAANALVPDDIPF
jgi:hypothetical protein